MTIEGTADKGTLREALTRDEWEHVAQLVEAFGPSDSDMHDRLRAALSSKDEPLDVAWREAEAALPGDRYIYLYGPIASGVYWARAPLFDGNKAELERLQRREPGGFAPVGAGPAEALRKLAAALSKETPA